MYEVKEKILKAIYKRRSLNSAIRSSAANVPDNFNIVEIGVKFKCNNNLTTISVEIQEISTTANASLRYVFSADRWLAEFIFIIPSEKDKVEVFRFYINDESMAENSDGELFGSIIGVDFINYICYGVYLGVLNSSVFKKIAN
jgi:hypothetical protein